MKIYNSFDEYVELFVIPRKNENPNQIRLDGKDSGGNREIAGVFRHRDKVWKVHGDTRFEPILMAYNVMKKESTDPFIERVTGTGKGTTLVLKDEFQQRLSKTKCKHLYIYGYNPK